MKFRCSLIYFQMYTCLIVTCSKVLHSLSRSWHGPLPRKSTENGSFGLSLPSQGTFFNVLSTMNLDNCDTLTVFCTPETCLGSKSDEYSFEGIFEPVT